MLDRGTISLGYLSRAVFVLELVGDITAASEGALMQAYQAASQQGADNLVLDFSRMIYMNSSGIGLLVTLLVRAKRQGQRMAAIGLDDHYRQIFHMTRLDEAIPVCSDISQALALLDEQQSE